MYSIRRVIMYNCHLAWWSGAIQRMLFSNIHWRSFTPRSKKSLETSKHPLNGDSDIFLFESIEGWSKKKDLETNIRSSDKSVYDGSGSIHKSQVNIYHKASVTPFVYEIRPKIGRHLVHQRSLQKVLHQLHWESWWCQWICSPRPGADNTPPHLFQQFHCQQL